MANISHEPNTKKAKVLTVGGVAFDVKLAVIIITATLLPTIDYYHDVTGALLKLVPLYSWKSLFSPHHAYDQLLLFFFAPLFVVLVLFRDTPSEYGLSFGNVKEGIVWTILVCPIMAIILWFLVRGSAMNDYYRYVFYEGAPAGATVIPTHHNPPPQTMTHLSMLWTSFLLIFPWEFLWRGFFLFGLARVIGPGPAIFIQAIPFALLHLGKPEVETLTTIFGGAGFGFVAWRTRSCLYPIVIHYFILVTTNLIASGVFN